jgi:hypothetical protein
VQELSIAARASETVSPSRAQRLWLHVRCLDPENEASADGIEKARPVRVFRPDVVAARRGPAEDAVATGLRLDAPIRVAPALASVPRAPIPAAPPAPANASPRPVPPPPPDWKRTDDALKSAETQLRDANFEAALAGAERVRTQLRDTSAADGSRTRQARAEIVAATAEIALGREDAARKSFQRALAADPGLNLDPATTSPKVRRAFEAAKGAKGGPP